MKKQKRYNFCENLEWDIQKRAKLKDKTFWLYNNGWKVFYCKREEVDVWLVNSEWVRNNLSVIFGHGGHGYVHEFIPLNEIWIDPKHYHTNLYDCGCNKKEEREETIETLIAHELTERKLMSKGVPFYKAHQIALKKERKCPSP